MQSGSGGEHLSIEGDQDISIQEDKSIYVCSIDMDGCVFNAEFRKLLEDNKQHGHRLSPKELETIIEKSNPELINHIVNNAKKHSKTIIMLGSNRQCRAIDIRNGFGNPSSTYQTGSAMFAIEAIHRIVQTKLKEEKKEITHDAYLLQDAWDSKDKACHHNDLKQEYVTKNFKKNLDNQYGLYFKPPDGISLDHVKFSMTYTQMHYVACNYSGYRIFYELIDDKGKEILKPLQELYHDYPQLKPKNTIYIGSHYGEVEKNQPIPKTPQRLLHLSNDQKEEDPGTTDRNYHTKFKEIINIVVESDETIREGLAHEKADFVFEFLAVRNNEKRSYLKEYKYILSLCDREWETKAGIENKDHIIKDAKNLIESLGKIDWENQEVALSAIKLLHLTRSLLKNPDKRIQESYREMLTEKTLSEESKQLANDFFRKFQNSKLETLSAKLRERIVRPHQADIKNSVIELIKDIEQKSEAFTWDDFDHTILLLTNIENLFNKPDGEDPLSVIKKLVNPIKHFQNCSDIQEKICALINTCVRNFYLTPLKSQDLPEIKKEEDDKISTSYIKEKSAKLIDSIISDPDINTYTKKLETIEAILKLIKDPKCQKSYKTILSYSENLPYSEKEIFSDFIIGALRLYPEQSKTLEKNNEDKLENSLKQQANSLIHQVVGYVSTPKQHEEKQKHSLISKSVSLVHCINEIGKNPSNEPKESRYRPIIEFYNQIDAKHSDSDKLKKDIEAFLRDAFRAAHESYKELNNSLAQDSTIIRIALTLVREFMAHPDFPLDAFPSAVQLLDSLKSYILATVDAAKEYQITPIYEKSIDVITQIKRCNSLCAGQNDLDALLSQLNLAHIQAKPEQTEGSLQSICAKYELKWTDNSSSLVRYPQQLCQSIKQNIHSIPASEQLLAIELLHRTDTLVHNSNSQIAQRRYTKTLERINTKAPILSNIVMGVSLVIIGTALLAGAIALAACTFGVGSPLSCLVAKGSAAVIVKGLIIGGVIGGGLVGSASLTVGVGTLKHEAKKPPKRIFLHGHRFSADLKEEKNGAQPPLKQAKR